MINNNKIIPYLNINGISDPQDILFTQGDVFKPSKESDYLICMGHGCKYDGTIAPIISDDITYNLGSYKTHSSFYKWVTFYAASSSISNINISINDKISNTISINQSGKFQKYVFEIQPNGITDKLTDIKISLSSSAVSLLNDVHVYYSPDKDDINPLEIVPIYDASLPFYKSTGNFMSYSWYVFKRLNNDIPIEYHLRKVIDSDNATQYSLISDSALTHFPGDDQPSSVQVNTELW